MTNADESEAGRTIIITGANTGIGRVTAEVLASRGAKVWLACRSRDKARPVVDAIRAKGGNAEILALDLANLAATREAAKRFLDTGEPLHILINNAGLAGARGKTTDGFELAFGTNHLGPFLFTKLLLPRLREAATAERPARIVNVSSKSHYSARGIPFDGLRESTKSVTGLPEYAVSKLCNVLFTKELARAQARGGESKSEPNLRSYALHPGVIASDIWRHVPRLLRPLVTAFMKSTEEGAETSLYCATAADTANEDGLYYDDCRAVTPSEEARDEALARELWRKSEEWTAPFAL